MAPRFQAAEPVVPLISAAYGAGEAMLRANPQLLAAHESAARMTAQTREAAADRAFRGQQAGLERASDADRVSAGAMAALGRQNVESQQAEFQRQHQQRLQLQDFQADAARQEFQARAELQTRAETQKLGSWLRRQEFTYADQLELQKQERQLRAVMNSEELGDGEKRRAALMLTSGIDALRMRQQETQAKMTEAHAKQYEAQAAIDTQVRLKNAELDSKTLAERTVTVPLPDGATATLYQTGYDQNGRPTYTQAKADASPQQKAMELDFKLAEKEIDLEMKIAEAESKAKGDERTIDLTRAREAISRIQQMRQGIRGGSGQQVQTGSGQVADPVVRQQITNVSGLVAKVMADPNPHVPPESKAAFAKGMEELSGLYAKPNKTAEDRKRITELESVRPPGEGIVEVTGASRRVAGPGNVVVGPDDPARVAARGDRMPAAPVNPFARMQYSR